MYRTKYLASYISAQHQSTGISHYCHITHRFRRNFLHAAQRPSTYSNTHNRTHSPSHFSSPPSFPCQLIHPSSFHTPLFPPSLSTTLTSQIF